MRDDRGPRANMELRQGALELQEENMRLRQQLSQLTAHVRELESADGEPCPRCRKRSWVVESSAPDSLLGVAGVSRRNYRCTECGFKESVLQTAK
jgi:transposase-like protein